MTNYITNVQRIAPDLNVKKITEEIGIRDMGFSLQCHLDYDYCSEKPSKWVFSANIGERRVELLVRDIEHYYSIEHFLAAENLDNGFDKISFYMLQDSISNETVIELLSDFKAKLISEANSILRSFN